MQCEHSGLPQQKNTYTNRPYRGREWVEPSQRRRERTEEKPPRDKVAETEKPVSIGQEELLMSIGQGTPEQCRLLQTAVFILTHTRIVQPVTQVAEKDPGQTPPQTEKE